MRKLLLCALVVICLPLTAEPPEEPPGKPQYSESVVVSATRGERKVGELPVSTTVVTEKDIKAAPALFVDDVLRTIPGVSLNFAGSASSFASSQRVSMHGLGGTRALVLLDGMPMLDPYYGTVQWQKVPLDSLRQIEVVRGANASLFGSMALGGTINLLTRPVERSVIVLDSAAGTAGTERYAITLDHRISEAFGVRLAYTGYDSAGYVRVPNPGPIDIRGWNDTTTGSARLDYTPSDTARAFLRLGKSKIDVSDGLPDSWSERDITDVAGGMQRLSGTAVAALNAFHQDQAEDRSVASIGAGRLTQFKANVTDIPVTSSGASFEWTMPLAGRVSLVSVGADVKQIEATEHREAYNRSGTLTQRNLVDGRQQFAGLYAQASWNPTAKLEILTSGRIDYYKNLDGVDAVIGGAVTEYPEATTTQFDPRVSFRYAVGDHSAIRGAAYRGFNAPTLRELYRSGTNSSGVTLGNPYLEPETLVGAEIGLEWTTARSRFEISLYRSDIDGLQVRAHAPGQPPNVSTTLNLGKSKSQGIEVMADVQLSRRWSALAGYAYADGKVTSDPDPSLIGKLIPEVVPHTGTLNLRYRGDRGTSADLRARILSTSYGEAANVVAAPAHRVFDVSVRHPLRQGLDVYALLENALDEKYFYVINPTNFRIGQPRTFTAGLRFEMPFAGARQP